MRSAPRSKSLERESMENSLPAIPRKTSPSVPAPDLLLVYSLRSIRRIFAIAINSGSHLLLKVTWGVLWGAYPLNGA